MTIITRQDWVTMVTGAGSWMFSMAQIQGTGDQVPAGPDTED